MSFTPRDLYGPGGSPRREDWNYPAPNRDRIIEEENQQLNQHHERLYHPGFGVANHLNPHPSGSAYRSINQWSFIDLPGLEIRTQFTSPDPRGRDDVSDFSPYANHYHRFDNHGYHDQRPAHVPFEPFPAGDRNELPVRPARERNESPSRPASARNESPSRPAGARTRHHSSIIPSPASTSNGLTLHSSSNSAIGQAQRASEDQLPQPPGSSSSDNSPDCSICLSPMPAPPNVAVAQPCNHEFCLNCIQQWIRTQQEQILRPDCPVCRGHIRSIVGRDGRVVGNVFQAEEARGRRGSWNDYVQGRGRNRFDSPPGGFREHQGRVRNRFDSPPGGFREASGSAAANGDARRSRSIFGGFGLSAVHPMGGLAIGSRRVEAGSVNDFENPRTPTEAARLRMGGLTITQSFSGDGAGNISGFDATGNGSVNWWI